MSYRDDEGALERRVESLRAKVTELEAKRAELITLNKERHAALANVDPAKDPSRGLGQLKVLLIGAGVLMTMVGVVTSTWPVLVLGLVITSFGILKR